MAEDDKMRYSTVGIALNSANQLMRIRPGDSFSYRNTYITVNYKALGEFEVLSQLPNRFLDDKELPELVRFLQTYGDTQLYAAQAGIGDRFLFRSYRHIAAAAGQLPEVDRKLPAACLIFAHVFEYLYRREFSDASIVQALTKFEQVASRREIIRQLATGVFSGKAEARTFPEALLMTDEYTAAHQQIMSVLATGDFDLAESELVRLCLDAESRFGMAHPVSQLYLAQVYVNSRRYRRAAQNLRRLFVMIPDLLFAGLDEGRTVQLRWVPLLLSCGINLSQSMSELGRFADGLRIAQEAIGLYRDCTVGVDVEYPEGMRDAMLGNQIALETDAITTVATCLDMLGDAETAAYLARGAMLRSWETFEENPGAARAQFLMAKILAEQGHLEEAFGHVENASSQSQPEPRRRLQWIYLRAAHGECQKASRELDDLLSSGALGEDRSLEAEASAVRAFIAEGDGRIDAARDYWLAAIDSAGQAAANASAHLADRELAAFCRLNFTYIYLFADFMRRHGFTEDGSVESLFEAVLRQKFFASDAQRHMREQTRGEKAFADLWQSLDGLRAKVGAARLIDQNALEHDAALKEMLFTIDDLEAAIAANSGGMRLSTVSIQDIREALPDNGALVEYLYVPTRDGEPAGARASESFYLVFVLTKQDLCLADLGSASEIDERVSTLSRKIAAGIQGIDRYSRALAELVWMPFANRLEDAGHVIVSPDGELTRVPYCALAVGDGLLADGLTLSYVSTGRDLASQVEPRRPAGAVAAVFADPDYNLGLEAPTKFGWERLAGAREEGRRIAELLGVSPLLDGDASEPRLRSLRSPSVLHLSTHGYFQDAAAVKLANRENLEPEQVRRLALKGGGIVLAGANAEIAGRRADADAGDEGIVNDLDVLSLDLAGTQLVVLSACDTGRGDVHVGEGIMGLTRSFLIAGADTLVFSLWKVPDEITRELMTHFYEQLIAGADCAAALTSARNAVRAEHPAIEAWAAFVCYGKTSPLQLAA